MGIRERISALVGSESREFLTHARNYLTGEAIVGVIGFVSLPVLTRLLTRAEYGTLGLFLAAVAVFSVLLELNFRGAVSRYYLERTDDFPDFLATNLLFLALMTVVSLSLVWLVREPLAGFFRLPPNVFYLAVACAALRIPWNLNWKLLVAQQRSARYATLNAFMRAAQFGIGATWVYLLAQDRHLGQIYANLLVIGAFGLGLTVWLVRQARGGRFAAKHLRYALWMGVPLIPHALSAFILSVFDQVILGQLMGKTATGLYKVAYEVGAIMSTIVMAMNQSWLPIFMDHRRTGQLEPLERLASTYAKYVYFIALMLVLFAEEAVRLLAHRDFHGALPLVPIIVFGYVGVFLYTLYSNYSFYQRKTVLISLATMISAGVNVALNYWAIPIWGIVAAAWTTLASYLLLFAVHFVIARFLLREPVLRLRFVIPWFLFSAAIAVAFAAARWAIANYWITLLAVKLPLVGLILWLLLRARLAELRRPEAS